MGANAQTSVPAFTSGQVLTAQQQTEINTGIPVFATTTTRDAAFGGTGEKTLAEGQFAYIEASNTTQYYDGAAWQSLSNTGWAVVSTTTLSAVSSASFNNVFTTTYETYRIIINVENSMATMGLNMKLRASGTDNTTNNYAYAGTGYSSAGSLDNATAEGQPQWEVGFCDAANIGFFVDWTIYNPQVAKRTTAFGGSMKGISTTRIANRFYGCTFNATTQFDGFSLGLNQGTITGKVTILGLVIS